MNDININRRKFFERFPNEESARLYLEDRRWGKHIFCAYCSSEHEQILECKNHKPMTYRCKICRKHFSVRTGTILAGSHIPLQKWLMAMYIMTKAYKKISSTQIAKELGITQKSAWFLVQRIRESWENKKFGKHLTYKELIDGSK